MAEASRLARGGLLASALVGCAVGCSGGGADPLRIQVRPYADAGGLGGAGGADEPVATGGTVGETGGSAPTGGHLNASGGTEPGGSAGSVATGGAPATGGDGGAGAGGGGAAQGTGGALNPCDIIPNDQGTVAPVPVCAIQGTWYAYDDCTTSPGDCTLNHLPLRGAFASEPLGTMCTSGSLAPIASLEELTAKWGAGIGLALNADSPIGELPKQIKEFSFTLSGPDGTNPILPTRVRVAFQTPDTVTVEHQIELGGYVRSPYRIAIEDAEQPSWVPDEQKVTLDWRQVTRIQFYVPTTGVVSEPQPFNFCIEGLTAWYVP